jgi:hypothetical protein
VRPTINGASRNNIRIPVLLTPYPSRDGKRKLYLKFTPPGHCTKYKFKSPLHACPPEPIYAKPNDGKFGEGGEGIFPKGFLRKGVGCFIQRL